MLQNYCAHSYAVVVIFSMALVSMGLVRGHDVARDLTLVVLVRGHDVALDLTLLALMSHII